MSLKLSLAVLEEYLKPKLFAMLEPSTRAGIALDFALAKRKPGAALHGGYTLADLAEGFETARDRPLELHFSVHFLEEYLYKDIAPRLAHPGFFGQRVFQRMLRKPSRESAFRAAPSLYMASRAEPFSAFSVFNSKQLESHPFGRSHHDTFLPRMDSLHAREDSLPYRVAEQAPQNFQNIGKLLGEEEAVQRIEPAQIRSVKAREETPGLLRRGEASPGDLPFSEDSVKFRGLDGRARAVRYDEDVWRLLHKI